MSRMTKRNTKYIAVSTDSSPKLLNPLDLSLKMHDYLKFVLHEVFGTEDIFIFKNTGTSLINTLDKDWSYDFSQNKGHPFISTIQDRDSVRSTNINNNLSFAKDKYLKRSVNFQTVDIWSFCLNDYLVVMAIPKNAEQSEFQIEFFHNISNFFNIDKSIGFDEISHDYLESVSTLIIQAISKKDTYTGGHTKRVGMFAEMICDELDCDDKFKREVAISAVIHDIGKIGIPDNILKKESPLTSEEFEIMKQHPSIGEEILKKIPGFETISFGVSCHHERPDGKGYPNGLKGDEIPLIAKIVSLSDAFDAMISTRPYRKAISPMDAFEILKESRGTQFDEVVFDAFEKAFLNSNISKKYRENLKKVG